MLTSFVFVFLPIQSLPSVTSLRTNAEMQMNRQALLQAQIKKCVIVAHVNIKQQKYYNRNGIRAQRILIKVNMLDI